MGNSTCCQIDSTKISHDDWGVNVNEMVSTSSRNFPHRLFTDADATKTRLKSLSGGGDCLLFLEKACHVPYHDPIRDLSCQTLQFKTHGNPYVLAWAQDKSGNLVGNRAEWPSKHCNTAPSWYAARSLGFNIGSTDVATLHLELRDGNTLIGSTSVEFGSLPPHSEIQQDLILQVPAVSGPSCCIVFQVIDSEEVSGKRSITLVRHGESRWNHAQSKLDLYEMGRQNDHPLSLQGRRQAEDLNKRIADAFSRGELDLKPDAIFVSPLTRAVQTAVIGLRTVLTEQRELVLMANAREKQNLGGFDSKPHMIGADVVKKVLDEIVLLYQDQNEATIRDVVQSFGKLRIDAHEVQDTWWCDASSETDAQVKARLDEFMNQLKYSPHRNIVVVGHSHFFREIFRKYLSERFKNDDPNFTWELTKKKLSNCGVAQLQIDPTSPDGPIVDVRIVLGTELVGDEGPCLCGAPDRKLHEHEIA